MDGEDLYHRNRNLILIHSKIHYVHFPNILGPNLYNEPKPAFSTRYFYLYFCHPSSATLCGTSFPTHEECSPDSVLSVSKALANKDVMSFELSTRIALGLKDPFWSFVQLFRKTI